MNQDTWKAPTGLKYYFTPTRVDRYGEIRKADIKNHNLPILQYWFHGNEKTPMKCVITNTIGFLNFPDIVTGKNKQRFVLDFNHIRQKHSVANHCGFSVDKDDVSPSDLFRTLRLNEKTWALVEMMATMPVNSLYHSFISQDSQKSDISLKNFDKTLWPWGLQNSKNFNSFCSKYGIARISYRKFIKALSTVDESVVGTYSVVKQWQMGFLK
jgi:hypothetical protein